MDNEAVVHIHNGILLSHKKNTFEYVLMRWMKLEPVIQSEEVREIEISYTDTNIWNLKRWHWWIYFQGSSGETDIENRPMDKVGGEEREGEMYWESNIEMYNTICKTDSQWEFALWLRKLKQGLCDRLNGGVGREMEGRSEREGTWAHLWLILVDA